jgi:hypothetical protein
MIETQLSPSTDNKALYEESRRLVEELDARTADITSRYLTTQEDDKPHGKVKVLLHNN